MTSIVTAAQNSNHAVTDSVPAGSIAVNDHKLQVDVTPGETVELPPPFTDAAGFAAKLVDGDLAIRVGDTIIVLHGYTAANDTAPVTIETAEGKPVDIATVLAATDPSLDIETAAGPVAVGPQAVASGHLLSSFDAGAGLGGLAAVGPLDQTALSYGLIDNAIRQERGAETNGADNDNGTGSLGVGSSGATVNEAALSTGSTPSSDAETTTGTITVSASSGVQSITIDGVTVDLADIAGTDPIKGTYGTLTVTGWDEATGTLTYSYTLSSAFTHDAVQGANSATGEDFSVTVADSTGQTGSGDISITIIDDVPTAVADSAVTCACGEASGNVLTNDTAGADGIARIASVTDGSHTYTLDASGALTSNDDAANYSYDAASGVLTIYATSGGGLLEIDLSGSNAGDYDYNAGASATTETFQYTIVDGDGDTASASLTIETQQTTTTAAASGDHIYTLSQDFDVAHSWLLANDTPGDGLSVTGTAHATGLSASDEGWGQHVTLDSGSSSGSFTYDITDSSSGTTDTATVAVDLVSSDSHAIDQSASTEDVILIGDGYDNTLSGGSGSDVLVGNGGTDTLHGNGGNDTMVYDSQDTFYGGDGTDRLTFGNGADIGFDSSFTDRVHSVEVLDIRNGQDDTMGAGSGEALSVSDVVDMTDGGNELWISAESGDKITLGSGFTQVADVTNTAEGDNIPNGTYATYTATDGTNTVVVHVDSAQVQVS